MCMICCQKTNFRSFYDEWDNVYSCIKGNGGSHKNIPLVRKFAFPVIGDIPLNKITVDQMDTILIHALEEEGTKAAFDLRKALVRAFDHAQERRWIGRINPAAEAVSFNKADCLLRIFNDDEIKKIIDACAEIRQGPVVLTALIYGIRPCYTLALRKENFDHDNMVISFAGRMKGRNYYPLANEFHIYVDERGFQDFLNAIALNATMDEVPRAEYAVRSKTGIRDFSFGICVDSFVMRSLKSGINPVDLGYYFSRSYNVYFRYMKHLTEEEPDSALLKYAGLDR